MILSLNLAWLINQAKLKFFGFPTSSNSNTIFRLVTSLSQAQAFDFTWRAKLEHALLDKDRLVYSLRYYEDTTTYFRSVFTFPSTKYLSGFKTQRFELGTNINSNNISKPQKKKKEKNKERYDETSTMNYHKKVDLRLVTRQLAETKIWKFVCSGSPCEKKLSRT